MSVFTAAAFHKGNGRLRGSYVYMLLCQDDEQIYIKVGKSDAPLRRLNELRTSCAVTPKLLAYAEVTSSRIALAMEKDIHVSMAPWQTTGEWYRFESEEKERFNEAWKQVFQKYAKPGWPLQWTKVSVEAIAKVAESRKRLYQHRWATRGRAYQDFAREPEARSLRASQK